MWVTHYLRLLSGDAPLDVTGFARRCQKAGVALSSLIPMQSLGIPVALVGSIFLAGGAILQQRGVSKGNARASASCTKRGRLQAVPELVRRPSWLLGTGMLILATLIQLISLYLAPLTVVQPLGALALVVTALVNARLTGLPLSAVALRLILFCVVGIALLAGILIALVVVHIMRRQKSHRLFYVVGAGVLFGFVATLAKSVITRVQTIVADGFHLVAADGLTVIDPIVGVTVGITVLGEAARAPAWAAIACVIAGLIATYGVIQLSHNQVATSPKGTIATDGSQTPH